MKPILVRLLSPQCWSPLGFLSLQTQIKHVQFTPHLGKHTLHPKTQSSVFKLPKETHPKNTFKTRMFFVFVLMLLFICLLLLFFFLFNFCLVCFFCLFVCFRVSNDIKVKDLHVKVCLVTPCHCLLFVKPGLCRSWGLWLMVHATWFLP